MAEDPERLRALEAVQQDGFALTSQRLKWQKDRGVVLEAVKSAGRVLQHVSDALRGDPEVVLEAVRGAGLALRYASREVRANREVALTAVKHNGLALKHASEEIQNDREVVLQAVKEHGRALQFASPALRGDEPIVLQAASQQWDAIELASEELRADNNFMRKVLGLNGLTISSASAELRADRDAVISAIKTYPPAWRYASWKLQKDKELLLMSARHLKENQVYSFSSEIEAIVDREIPRQAIDVPLAVRGEEAPVVSAKLFLAPEAGAEQAEGTLLCRVSLLSGTTFEVEVGVSGSQTSGVERPAPVVADLASKIIETLPTHVQVADIHRIFLILVVDDDGSALPVSPLDWNRSLAEYISPM